MSTPVFSSHDPSDTLTLPHHPSTAAATTTTTPTSTTTTSTPFTFPPHYSFPPFFTLQPNLTTRASQLSSWSSLIQSHCAHSHLFSLLPSTAQHSPPFTNPSLNRRLSPRDVLAVLAYMASPEGGRRAEWADPARNKAASAGKDDGDLAAAGKVWIFWRRPEEWADAIEAWVGETGQRGAVLTLYELTESDAVGGKEWAGMDGDMLRKSLNVLVKKGRAQVFGQGEDLGVKFF